MKHPSSLFRQAFCYMDNVHVDSDIVIFHSKNCNRHIVLLLRAFLYTFSRDVNLLNEMNFLSDIQLLMSIYLLS